MHKEKTSVQSLRKPFQSVAALENKHSQRENNRAKAFSTVNLQRYTLVQVTVQL